MKTIERFLGGIKRAITNPAEYRKAYVFLTTVPAQLIALGVLHGSALHWASVGIPVITTVLAAIIANEPTTAPDVGAHYDRKSPSVADTASETTYERINQTPGDSTGSVA